MSNSFANCGYNSPMMGTVSPKTKPVPQYKHRVKCAFWASFAVYFSIDNRRLIIPLINPCLFPGQNGQKQEILE